MVEKNISLNIFFNAKTHELDCPLKEIVCKQGTLQKSVALLLQKKLNLLTVDDSFLQRDSYQLIRFLSGHCNKSFNGFSVNIKYLFYLLPHGKSL